MGVTGVFVMRDRLGNALLLLLGIVIFAVVLGGPVKGISQISKLLPV
jgi:hypothetical protein